MAYYSVFNINLPTNTPIRWVQNAVSYVLSDAKSRDSN